MKEFIIHWNSLHRFDSWWRKKYKVAFNSEQHRQSNQFDIAFEYIEDKLEQSAIKNIMKHQAKLDEFKKTGEWIKQNEQKEKQLFDKIDLNDF